MKYPETRKENIEEVIFGRTVHDPYRWMEDAESDEVKTWVAEQNKLTEEWFVDSEVTAIAAALQAEQDVASQSLPYRRGEWYFWYERQPGQMHSVLYRSRDFRGNQKEVVFDVNQLSDDGSVSLDRFSISRLATYAVYGIAEAGTERSRLFIRDLSTGSDEEFWFGRTFYMSWSDDETGFYYVRSDYAEHGADPSDESHYQQAYFHRIGQSRDQDRLLFDVVSEGYDKEVGVALHGSEDNEYVALNMTQGWVKRKIFIAKFGESFEELMPEIEARKGLKLIDGYAYVTTDFEANNNKVLRSPIAECRQPLIEWQEFIPEQDRKLESWQITKSRVLVEYIRDISAELELLDRQGKLVKKLAVASLATVSSISASQYNEEYFYRIATFLSPFKHYRGDSDGEVELVWTDARSLDELEYEAKMEWYASTDGTKVPLSIISRKDLALDGRNPTILYAYGGFGNSRYPGFVGMYKPWLKAGGVVAFANIRGGGEFGIAWHKAGMLAHKQQSFDDFMAAAEFLIEQKITRPVKLAISGGSNGGLLVAACLTQRPELFGAVIADVPLTDMVRYDRFLIANRWRHEYGDPAKEEEFAWLWKYSPYHRVNVAMQYPAVYLSTGINDSRVHPMHAWKMAAALQVGSSTEPILLETRDMIGHGQGRSFYANVEVMAKKLAFAAKALGVRIL